MKERAFAWNSRRAPFMALAFFLLYATALSAQTLKIISPADGTVVNPGDLLRVSAAASGAKFDVVMLIGENPLDFYPPVHENPYEFSVPIPSDIRPGEYRLTVTGNIVPGKGIEAGDSISIDIERPDAPVELHVEFPPLGLRIGDMGYLGAVRAGFSDGTTLDVSRSTRISYRCDAPAIVKLNPYGQPFVESNTMMKALAPGVANITVSYGKLSTRFSVGVSPPVIVLPSGFQVNQSQTYQFYVQLAMQEETDHTVTWSIQPEVGSIGADGPYTALYTAPSSVTAPLRVIVTAASVADKTWSGSAELTVLPPIAVHVRPVSVRLKSGMAQKFSVLVANTLDQYVNWSLTPPGAGTLVLAKPGDHCPVGAQTSVVYKAPAVIKSAQTVTITATRQADAGKTASASIVLVP